MTNKEMVQKLNELIKKPPPNSQESLNSQKKSGKLLELKQT